MMAIDIIMDNLKLYSVDECGYSFELTPEQVDFVKSLLSKINKKNAYEAFRGISISRISDMFNTRDLYSILSYYFLLGEKAAHFYRNKIIKDFENIDEVISKIEEMKLGQYFSGQAFENIKEILIDNKPKTYAYYSYILHVLNMMNNPNYSHLLSATDDYDKAKEFSHGTSRKADGVILFIVKPNYHLSQTSNLDSDFEKILIANQLPIHNDGTLYNEEEVNFIFGVYPHSIYAIQDNKTEKIYINPSLLKIIDNIEKQKEFLRTLEIDVDQSLFEEKVQLTNIENFIIHENGSYKFKKAK